jgi:hypothetical protein
MQLPGCPHSHLLLFKPTGELFFAEIRIFASKQTRNDNLTTCCKQSVRPPNQEWANRSKEGWWIAESRLSLLGFVSEAARESLKIDLV